MVVGAAAAMAEAARGAGWAEEAAVEALAAVKVAAAVVGAMVGAQVVGKAEVKVVAQLEAPGRKC